MVVLRELVVFSFAIYANVLFPSVHEGTARSAGKLFLAQCAQGFLSSMSTSMREKQRRKFVAGGRNAFQACKAEQLSSPLLARLMSVLPTLHNMNAVTVSVCRMKAEFNGPRHFCAVVECTTADRWFDD